VGLQLGAFGVVLETTASGIADLPFGVFVLLMQPIHLAIGVIEGLVSAAVIAFVARARPATFDAAPSIGARHTALYGLLAAAILAGGIASWFASTRPDGLEWAIARVTGGEEVQHPGDALHRRLARAQERTSILPDYGFKTRATDPADAASAHAPTPDAPPRRPAPDAGTSASGLLGGLVTLGVVCLAGAALRRGTGRSHTPRELW
jgi:cobalt/nickel transport system permease protein